ncbi:esterase [Penicillium daleae]|uniref:Esterase n=1 Tax=Penicillium daleae TaxID=63821 RepID=A0AAD6G8V7_9EURO|nr:esterase [Penicillium daleae]KAJ5464757.1 esterase [Penicillium daleae]
MTALRFVKSVWESFRATSGLEPRLLNNLRVTAARPGTVNFELDIQKEHTNRLNILHGGTIASMVDLGGSLAVASRGLFATGVSTDLNGMLATSNTGLAQSKSLRVYLQTTYSNCRSVTYLSSGGKIGDKIMAEVTCDKFGKTLAYTNIKFTNEKGDVVARGSHTKYVSFAWKDPQNIVEEINKLQQD